MGLFTTPYISRTNSFPGGFQEAEGCFRPAYHPLILIEQINFQEALERLKGALGLFTPPYIGRTNSFPGGFPEAEGSFRPAYHPLILVEQINFQEALERLKGALGLVTPPLILVEQIHFREAFKRLKGALGLLTPRILVEQINFQEALERLKSNKFISGRLSRG